MVIISCARILPFLCYVVARARHGALSRRRPVTRGFFARNNVATRYLQKKQPLNGPPLTRSRRGNGFRGFPAAHPKPVFSSALFTLITTQRQREPATHETTSYFWYSVILPPTRALLAPPTGRTRTVHVHIPLKGYPRIHRLPRASRWRCRSAFYSGSSPCGAGFCRPLLHLIRGAASASPSHGRSVFFHLR